MTRHRSTRGNAMFLILIGVIMFAALIYAISSNWRTSGSIATVQQASLNADDLIEYGNGLRLPINRMLQLGGVTDTNIWFAATGADPAYGAVGANPTAEVFNASGGTATYQTPPAAACKSTCVYDFTGQYSITGVGTSAPELVMLAIDIDATVCQKVNDLLKTGWTTVPVDATLTSLVRFNGSTYGSSPAITLTGASNEFVGKQSFCYRETGGSQRYIYLHVIRVR